MRDLWNSLWKPLWGTIGLIIESAVTVYNNWVTDEGEQLITSDGDSFLFAETEE